MKILLSLALALACAAPISAQERPVFWVSFSVLMASSALDYHSGVRAESRGYREMNPGGRAVGSLSSAALCGALGYWIYRQGGRYRWLGSALVAGAAVPHFYAGIHNYSLR